MGTEWGCQRGPNLRRLRLPSWPRRGCLFLIAKLGTLDTASQPGSLTGTVWAGWVLGECPSCVSVWLLPAALWESLGSRGCVLCSALIRHGKWNFSQALEGE